jgi:hypothetical protein
MRNIEKTVNFYFTILRNNKYVFPKDALTCIKNGSFFCHQDLLVTFLFKFLLTPQLRSPLKLMRHRRQSRNLFIHKVTSTCTCIQRHFTALWRHSASVNNKYNSTRHGGGSTVLCKSEVSTWKLRIWLDSDTISTQLPATRKASEGRGA